VCVEEEVWGGHSCPPPLTRDPPAQIGKGTTSSRADRETHTKHSFLAAEANE